MTWHPDMPDEFKNQIVTGDARELTERIPDESIDLTITSPPYDNMRVYDGYKFDFEAIARELYRVTTTGGVVVWVVADQTIDGSETGTSFRQALFFKEIGFYLHDTMIYQVKGTGAKGSNYAYWQAFEYMFIFSKGKPSAVNRIKDVKNKRAGVVCTKGRITSDGNDKDLRRRIVPEYSVRTNVWTYHAGNNGDDDTDHPAPFPEALAHDHILSWSNPDSIVLDPMCGSGTTCKEAKLLSRCWIGFDISEGYVIKARERVLNTQPPLFVLESEQLPLELGA